MINNALLAANVNTLCKEFNWDLNAVRQRLEEDYQEGIFTELEYEIMLIKVHGYEI